MKFRQWLEGFLNLKDLDPKFYDQIVETQKAKMRKQILTSFVQSLNLIDNDDFESARQFLRKGYELLKIYWDKTGDEFESQAAKDGMIAMFQKGTEKQIRQRIFNGMNEVGKSLAQAQETPNKKTIGMARQTLNFGVIGMLANHSPGWRQAMSSVS